MATHKNARGFHAFIAVMVIITLIGIIALIAGIRQAGIIPSPANDTPLRQGGWMLHVI